MTENEKHVLLYLYEHCAGTTKGYGIPFRRAYWQTSASVPEDIKPLIEQMDWGAFDAAVASLRQSGQVDGGRSDKGWTVHITTYGRDCAEEVKMPDRVAAYEDAARRDPFRSGLIVFHKAVGPFVGYVALAISLLNFIRDFLY